MSLSWHQQASFRQIYQLLIEVYRYVQVCEDLILITSANSDDSLESAHMLELAIAIVVHIYNAGVLMKTQNKLLIYKKQVSMTMICLTYIYITI